MLLVVETHPIQYHAPVYRAVQTEFGVPVTVIYGSDFSVAGYHDREFDATFAWDNDLLSGYQPLFLSQVSKGGASAVEDVSSAGLSSTVRKLSPRAVLIGGYGHSYHRAGFHAARRNGCPILFRAETNDHTRRRNLPRTIVRDTTLRWWYQKCAKLLFIGECSREHYIRLGVTEDKLIFSPYCVDVSQFETDERARGELRERTRARLGIDDKQIVILFSGKLSRPKGLDLLIRAVKKTETRTRQRITVLFVGSGELKTELQAAVEEDPIIDVRFAGFQNQRQLSPYYHAADLLVLPSYYSETWGVVINEALSHGLPCVVSGAVGCARDLIQPGVSGEIFEVGSVESLVSAIGRALGLTRRIDVREHCRHKVGNYTVSKAAHGIAAAYQAVAS